MGRRWLRLVTALTLESAISKQQTPSLLAAPFIRLPISAIFSGDSSTRDRAPLPPQHFAFSLLYLHFQFLFVRSESRQSLSVAASRLAAAFTGSESRAQQPYRWASSSSKCGALSTQAWNESLPLSICDASSVSPLRWSRPILIFEFIGLDCSAATPPAIELGSYIP